MKKLLMMSLMLLSFALLFTACSDDDTYNPTSIGDKQVLSKSMPANPTSIGDEQVLSKSMSATYITGAGYLSPNGASTYMLSNYKISMVKCEIVQTQQHLVFFVYGSNMGSGPDPIGVKVILKGGTPNTQLTLKITLADNTVLSKQIRIVDIDGLDVLPSDGNGYYKINALDSETYMTKFEVIGTTEHITKFRYQSLSSMGASPSPYDVVVDLRGCEIGTQITLQITLSDNSILTKSINISESRFRYRKFVNTRQIILFARSNVPFHMSSIKYLEHNVDKYGVQRIDLPGPVRYISGSFPTLNLDQKGVYVLWMYSGNNIIAKKLLSPEANVDFTPYKMMDFDTLLKSR